jgi:hypothetical protein
MTDRPEVHIRLSWPQAYATMEALREYAKRVRGNRELETLHKATADVVLEAIEEAFRNQDPPREVGNA